MQPNMASKKKYPEYQHPFKPSYTPIEWYTGNIKIRDRPKANIWTPHLILDPWLHYSTFTISEYINDRGYGPSWTCPYTLREFLVNWSINRWPVSKLSEKYCNEWFTENQLSRIRRLLNLIIL
jgi:hypothetical protein